jgi:hypothetical protein
MEVMELAETPTFITSMEDFVQKNSLLKLKN